MKKIYPFLVLLLIAGLVFVPASQVKADPHTILEFNTMIGVPTAYIGAKAPIRGLNAGGLPWVIAFGAGELSASGKLEVTVKGLVLDPNSPLVPANLKGTNPVASFKAVVSCQSVDASGAAAVMNVFTGLFPATTGPATSGGGNANIEAQLALPNPCIAPIIFVTSPGNAWFAATGF